MTLCNRQHRESAVSSRWPQLQGTVEKCRVALFRAQSLGGDNYQFYQAEMNSRALGRLTMEGELPPRDENGELRLHYQPQLNLRDHHIVGAER